MKAHFCKLSGIRAAFIRDLGAGDLTPEKLQVICSKMTAGLEAWLDGIQKRVMETPDTLRVVRKTGVLTLKKRRLGLTHGPSLEQFATDPTPRRLRELRTSLSMLYYIVHIAHY